MSKEKKLNKHIQPLSLLWRVMTKKNKVHFFLLLILGFITSASILIPTQMISLIISKLSKEEMNFLGIEINSTTSYVTVIIVAGIVTFLMRNLNTQYSLSMEKLVKRVVCNMRIENYNWLITPRKNMDLKMTDGDAIYRLNEGPEYITTIISNLLTNMLPTIFSGIIAFIYITLIDIVFLPIILVSLLLVFTCVIIRTKLEKGIAVKTETTKSIVSNGISNAIANLPIINLYKSMALEHQIFKQKIENFYVQQKKQVNLRIFYWTIAELIEVICTFGVIYFCASKIMADTMSVGNIVVVANYISSIFAPIQTIGYFSTMWVQCSVKINRLYEIKPNKQDLLPLQSYNCNEITSLELKNVNIQNGNIFKIKDVNMRFEKGEMTVLTGESGCGKSTIIKVLCGLCEKNSGSIILNDKEKIPTAYLISDKMSVTMQDPYIFNRDVKLNVLYPDGKIYTNTKEIIELLSMESLYSRKFNEEKQQNLENTLSGGEKKRINISRGLLKPADIYIFDEPTNDLDAKNANNIIKLIRKLSKSAIVIVVSHDKRILEKADKLIKIENKEILVNQDL